MARKNDYGLPDETLQLIAAGPDLISDPRYLQARQTFDSRMPGSELIKALRSYGTDNSGFTRYANDSAAGPTRALGGRRGLFNPSQLGMKRIPRDVTLPGAETAKVMGPLPTSPLIYPDVIDDKQIEDWPGDYVEDTDYGSDKGVAAVDTIYTPDVITGTVITDGGSSSVVGGTGNDTITGGTGGGGTGGGTGGGGTGGGGTGTSGGTGTAGTGTVGTAITGTTGTGSTGTGDSLRDAITAAVNGSGASIDNSAAGLNTSSASNTLGSALTADQLAALTKPKVPNVTLEVSGNGLSLDDAGSKAQTYDYPKFLTPEELKAYEQWLKQSSGLPSGGATGGGKPADDTYGNILEF